MLKIVDSKNRRAVQALLAPERVRDAATDRRVAAIVTGVRRGGDRALLRYARKFDGLDEPIEVKRSPIELAWFRRREREEFLDVERRALFELPLHREILHEPTSAGFSAASSREFLPGLYEPSHFALRP